MCTQNKYKDGEWEYIEYYPLEQSIVPCPVKTRYVRGMAWFDKFELAKLLGCEVRDIRRYLDESEANGELSQEHIAILEDKTQGGRKFDIKCYDATVALKIADYDTVPDKQFLLWIKSKSSLDTEHEYEKHVLKLMKENDEIEKKHTYNIFDLIWYNGEWVEEEAYSANKFTRSDGYMRFFVFLLPIIVTSIYCVKISLAFLFIPIIIFAAYFLRFINKERRWAIKVHYGLNRYPGSPFWTSAYNKGLWNWKQNVLIYTWLIWSVIVSLLFLQKYVF